MIGLGRAVDRSLYTAGRVWEDWSPFALFVVLVAVVFGLAGAIWVTVARYTAHDWHIFGVYALSEFLLVVFASDKTKKLRDFDGEVLVWTIDAIARHSYIVDLRDRMLGDALGAALWGGGIGGGLLIGTVLVLRIVYWRKVRQRRRRAGEKRTTLESRRWIGRRLKSTLHSLPASVRFVWKSITRRALASSTKSGEAKPVIGNRHAVDAAASDFTQRRRSPGSSTAFNDPTARPLLAARSEPQNRANTAEMLPDEAGLRFDQRPDCEAHLVPRETLPSATTPPAPTVTSPAAIDNSAILGCSDSASRKPCAQGQDCHDVGASGAGDIAPTGSDSTQQHEAAARDDGSNSARSTVSHGERAASDERMPGSNQRPLGTRPGAKRRRRKASQDFY
ncbi:MAG: hypothetical protein OXI57_06880 [Rhodospirillales bacterium]|nr:hypothetical protein [Rhodospirillales bacterium]